MFEIPAETVSDEELEAVLEAALRCSSGQLTRPAECWMATMVARHLADRLALAGLTVVRTPARRLS